MKKNYSIVSLVQAFIIIASALLFSVTAHSQDLTAEQKQERCQNNKNKIAELEAQLKVIDADLSNKKPALINKKNEINKQLAIHRNRLIELGCDSKNSSKLSGNWSCNDGGTYIITQNGNNIVWEGTSSDQGKSWSHTFDGEIKGDSIVGKFADHPPGATKNSGPLTIKIINNNRLEKASLSIFGGSVWTKL